MKKHTKTFLIPCAAAALTIGSSMMAFAATGWQEEDGTWSRNTEWHEQRAYTREQLEQALQQAGLRVRHVYGSPGGQRVGEQTRRLFFVAEKP